MMNRHRAHSVSLPFCVLAALLVVAARATTADTVVVQLLAFNDFHGNLQPPAGSNGRVGNLDAGGAEYLSTHLATLAAANPHTLIVTAGDLIGASPLLSGMFHDEPSVESLNAMGVDVSSVGNHEFDAGWRELLRMQHGGCHPVEGCHDNRPFAGAAFQYLAANVVFEPNDMGRSGPVLPAYVIEDVGGVRVGFIGLVLRATPELVMPAGVEGLRFEAEAATANRWARVLKAQKVRAIVVLIHEGGVPANSDDYNGCPAVKGPITKIAERMSDDIDVIVSGHTHQAYNCTIDGKLVTSAAAFGRVISSIQLTVDTRTEDVVAKSARNVIVTRDVPKDPAQTAIIERYRPFYAVVADKVVGTIAGDLARAPNIAGESTMGNALADATLEGASAAPGGGAVAAFVNPGGIRADLVGPPPGGEPRPVTYAEASSVLPFRNRVVVQTMSGAQIKEVLEQQFDNIAQGQDRILQVSRGFSYSYDRTAPRSRRVDAASLTIEGRRVLPNLRYRVAINEFIAAGGDNFAAFTGGSAVTTIGLDLDILIAYFNRHSPIAPPQGQRISRIK